MGRPHADIEPADLEKLCSLIAAGVGEQAACKLVKTISERTHFRYKKLGQEPNAPEPYASYWQAVSRALAQGEASDILEHRKLGADLVTNRTRTITHRDGRVELIQEPVLLRRGDPRVFEFRLERLHRARWGRHETVEHVHTAKSDLQRAAEQAGVTVDELKQEYERLFHARLDVEEDESPQANEARPN
jgi:hypothetical protein